MSTERIYPMNMVYKHTLAVMIVSLYLCRFRSVFSCCSRSMCCCFVSRIWFSISPHGLLHHTTAAHQTTTPIIHCTYDAHIPIHHCTNHSAVTNHSFALIVSLHLHLIHTRTLPCTHCEVLFLPRLTFLSITHPAVCYLCV